MLFIIRVVCAIIYCIIVCTVGSVYCLFSIRNPKYVSTFSHIFGRLAPLFGLKIEMRAFGSLKNFNKAVYIANHQNNYDLITVSNIVQPMTVIVGKKSILWIPFFGQLYWLSGNLLVDRDHHVKAYNMLKKVINLFEREDVSVWIFPEGTRNHGQGLLPFKTGAFYSAIIAGIPIIPVCVSNTSNKINLNRLNNGLVIIEMLPPVDASKYGKKQVRELAMYCRELMINKIDAINKEVKKREANQKV